MKITKKNPYKGLGLWFYKHKQSGLDGIIWNNTL